MGRLLEMDRDRRRNKRSRRRRRNKRTSSRGIGSKNTLKIYKLVNGFKRGIKRGIRKSRRYLRRCLDLAKEIIIRDQLSRFKTHFWTKINKRKEKKKRKKAKKVQKISCRIQSIN